MSRESNYSKKIIKLINIKTKKMSKPRIFVAGHKGMVGSALIRFLIEGNNELIMRDRKELDLFANLIFSESENGLGSNRIVL